MSSGLTCSSRRTDAVGSANSSSPVSTSTTRRSASDNGRSRTTVVPCSGSDWIRTDPPSRTTTFFTTSIPTPRPETSVVDARVLKPGWKTRSSSSAAVHRSRSAAGASARRIAAARSSSGSIPRPSSRTEMRMRFPCCSAEISSWPAAGLTLRSRSAGPLDAVVDGVADQVNQRIRDLLDDLLVELRLTAA